MSKTWPDIKQEYKNRYSPLELYIGQPLNSDITTLRGALSQYVQNGGISSDPTTDPTYATILAKSNSINTKKQELLQLNSDLANEIKNFTKGNDMDSILLDNGTLQAHIKSLEKDAAEAKDDEKAAELRDQVLRSRDTAITKHQLFLLGRPLRPSFIPFLWALSALFVGTAILLYTYFFPIPPELWPMTIASIMTTLGNPWVWGSLFGAACIVIFFLVLKIVGYFR